MVRTIEGRRGVVTNERRLSAYKELRAPNNRAVTTATRAPPPVPRIPTRANCEAPVNIARLRNCVCHTSRPLATEIAPNDSP